MHVLTRVELLFTLCYEIPCIWHIHTLWRGGRVCEYFKRACCFHVLTNLTSKSSDHLLYTSSVTDVRNCCVMCGPILCCCELSFWETGMNLYTCVLYPCPNMYASKEAIRPNDKGYISRVVVFPRWS